MADDEIESLRAEVERLKGVIREAFEEGFDAGINSAAAYSWGNYGYTAKEAWGDSKAVSTLKSTHAGDEGE